jgi:hypothetical protein
MPVSAVKAAAASSFPAYVAATAKPSACSFFEMAAPMPRDPPVTSATLPMI